MLDNFDEATLSKALGFKIPDNLKQVLGNITNEPLKTVN